MRWRELEEEQRKPLEYKIDVARQVIAQALAVEALPALAFSAGKDSTVLLHLIRQVRQDIHVIYGNTCVEYPECVKFARQIAADWRLNFHETKLLRTEREGYKYAGQRMIWERLIATKQINRVLKPNGQLKSTAALEQACPKDLAEEIRRRGLVWPAGTRKTYWWCVDQYGWPLLGKSWSRLLARRINIDTFLRFSKSTSADDALLRYYAVLRQVKISQACCDVIKKEPAKVVQAELGVGLVFKGLMAAESRARAKNFLTRGYLFQGKEEEYLHGERIWHCQPLAIWTDDDIWAYIARYNVPRASLYDITYTAADGTRQRIKRNGCMGCATDLLFANNHMAVLRRTHPKAWRSFMGQGMAEEIRKLQLAMRKGQMGMFDIFSAAELMEMQPCIFDDLDGVGFRQPAGGDEMTWDPEAESL
jgi:3'-phosphoadenosine 5'-phosphosulfate sulfotransferase (PAPS reductase)/FAD synthetase